MGAHILRWSLICLAVGLAVLLICSHDQGNETISLPEPPLARGEGARIVKIERVGEAGTLRMERRNGTWRIYEPIADLAGIRTVRELFRTLENLEVRRVLDTDSLQLYGLDAPSSRMTLHTRQGRSIEVRIGTVSPATGEVYAWWDGLAGVALLPRYVAARFFENEVFDWREHGMLPRRRMEIDSVCVSWGTERTKIRRLGQEEWAFLEPQDREADGLSCERAVAAFWRFSFLEFYDDRSDWPVLQLHPPRATWVVYRGAAVDTLFIGGRTDLGSMAVQLAGRVPGRVRDDLFEFLTGGIEKLEVRRMIRGRARDQRIVALTGEGEHRCYVQRSRRWFLRALSLEESRGVEGGLAPDTTEGLWVAASDESFADDLARLFELQGDAWLPASDVMPRASFPLRLHMWDARGTHQWLLLRRDAGSLRGIREAVGSKAAEPGSHARPVSYEGVGLGSRFPAKPMKVSSPRILAWELRLARPLPSASSAARPFH